MGPAGHLTTTGCARTPAGRYLAWAALAVGMAAASIAARVVSHPPDAAVARQGLPEPDFVRDTKVRRTARSFAMLSGLRDTTPLYEVNREGLPISIELDDRIWQLMLVPGNRETYKRRSCNATVVFAGLGPRPAVLSLRGGGTLGAPGKPNFDIRLLRAEELAESVPGKRLFLMNMHFDPAEVELVWAYRLLRQLDLFPLHHQYVAVSVNGTALGMYLLVEQPLQGLRRAHPDAAVVYRRRAPNVYERVWSDAVPSPGASLRRLRSLVRDPDPADPIDAFGQCIELDAYMRWTAFNALLLNFDSLDELFLFEARETAGRPAPLSVMAWDYDDVLSEREKEDAISHPLKHSVRGDLDAAIIGAPALQQRYREVLRALLDELTPDRLIGELRAVRSLRDGLDDGRPAAVQAEMAAERRRTVRRYGRMLRQRHAELVERLGP
ncbi:MAG: CotH kinase family protein [Planctomycetota bacterium]|jgi:hypothetical protein